MSLFPRVDPVVERLPDDLKPVCACAIDVLNSASFIDGLLRHGNPRLAGTITRSTGEFRARLCAAQRLLAPVLLKLGRSRGPKSCAHGGDHYPTAHQAALAVAEVVARGVEDAAQASQLDDPSFLVREVLDDPEDTSDPALWQRRYVGRLLEHGAIVEAGDGFWAGPFWRGFCAAYEQFVPRFEIAALEAEVKLEAALATSEPLPTVASAARMIPLADNAPRQEGTPADEPDALFE